MQGNDRNDQICPWDRSNFSMSEKNFFGSSSSSRRGVVRGQPRPVTMQRGGAGVRDLVGGQAHGIASPPEGMASPTSGRRAASPMWSPGGSALWPWRMVRLKKTRESSGKKKEKKRNELVREDGVCNQWQGSVIFPNSNNLSLVEHPLTTTTKMVNLALNLPF
jgi:hypothetical protein